jgi:hypothetical protein
MKIDFAEAYKNVKEPHINHLFFEKLIATYDCFGEEKWPSRKAKPPVKERPKIGIQDTSVENQYKKTLILSLNKLTATNMDTVGMSIVKNYKVSFKHIFVATIWEYFTRQPAFQDVYIKMIEKFTNINDFQEAWSVIYKTYIRKDVWKISYDLIEQSHNYDDFCEYIKEKKRLNAMAQGWARLMKSGIVCAEPFHWCHTVIDLCLSFDLANVVYRTMVDSYIEQIKEYCKHISVVVPPELLTRVNSIGELNIQKSTKFKIEDFVNENKK